MPPAVETPPPPTLDIQETPRTPADRIRAVETLARNDFLWSCDNLLWIRPKEKPIMRLELKWAQRYIATRYLIPAWKSNQAIGLAILKARREGISTLCAAWNYHKLRFHPGQQIIMAAHRDDTVDELHQMNLRFHNNLPDEMRPPTSRSNRKELRYPPPLEGTIRVLPMAYIDISRGKTISQAHLSEAAYAPDMEVIMGGLNEAVPDRGRTSIIIETTSNGMDNWWFHFWHDLGRRRHVFPGRRQWFRVFLPWYADPEHVSPVPINFQITEEETERKKRYQLTDGQLVWYRMKSQEMELLHPGTGHRMMLQEYPATADESFIASGSCIFSEEAMDRLLQQQRNPSWGMKVHRLNSWRFTMRPSPISEADLYIWEQPQAGYQYVIGVDVSEGLGKDSSAIVVLRMPGFVQVAEWIDDRTSTAHLAGIIAAIARYYAQAGNRPLVNVEVTGAGNDTNSRLNDIYADEPFDLYIWQSFDRLAPSVAGPSSRTGWVQTHVSKHILVSTANSILVDGFCEIPSSELQSDMRATQEESFRTYATTGHDLCIAWMLAVVAAWRDVAKWDLMGMVDQSRAKPETPKHTLEPWQYDSTWQQIQEPAGPFEDRWGSDRVDWLLQ